MPEHQNQTEYVMRDKPENHQQSQKTNAEWRNGYNE